MEQQLIGSHPYSSCRYRMSQRLPLDQIMRSHCRTTEPSGVGETISEEHLGNRDSEISRLLPVACSGFRTSPHLLWETVLVSLAGVTEGSFRGAREVGGS